MAHRGSRRSIFRPITDANTRIAEMLSGGLDIMVEVPPDSLQQFRTDGQFSRPRTGRPARLVPDPEHQGRALRQQGASGRPPTTPSTRTALVDNVLQGTAEVAAGPTPPAFAWAYNEDLEPYPYDPDKAKALLKEAGYNGEPADLLRHRGRFRHARSDRHGHRHPGRPAGRRPGGRTSRPTSGTPSSARSIRASKARPTWPRWPG